jgi:thioredoxin-related protein
MAAVLFGLIGVVFSADSLQAQEVRWRSDFTAARKEAVATGKPMLLDFGTQACMWCRKLDVTTFRDRAIIEFLNEKFIPVKVDGEREERLTQSVGVQAFPTLVVVSSEGKIIGRHEGYASAAEMMALLRKAPAKAEPKPSAVPPHPAPKSAAGELLLAARADFDAGRYLQCIQNCDKLKEAYGASPEIAGAQRLVAAIVRDPGKWKRVTGQLEADLAAVKRDLEVALKTP